VCLLFVLLNGRLNGHLKSIQKHTIPDPGKLSTSVTNPAHRRAQKKTAKKAVPYKLKVLLRLSIQVINGYLF